METNETRFEEDIETSLITEGGFTKGSMDGYNKQFALNINELVAFIEETQPKQWARYKTIYSSNPKEELAKRFDQEVKKRGLLDVLRRGFKDRGVGFRVVYFKPETSLNEEVSKRYEANRLQAIRQFSYSQKNRNTIDLVLMLNGIPIVALELKDQLTGQTIEDAKHQWKTDRNHYEKIFQLNRRFLVYFAVDLYKVAMTTELKGGATKFLPFNQGTNGPGNDGGAGNSQNAEGFTTSYLWEKVLDRHSLLMLIQRFIHLEIKRDKSGNKTGEALIFPRYHQYDVVKKIVKHTKRTGPGENYLIQHSAGSGKSYSIAWLAYRLSTLHDDKDQPVYNSIIVVTDRRVLDQQLQDTIKSIDHIEGVVAAIDDRQDSNDLQEAIESERKIIITTLQKFPYIVEEVELQIGKNFAVIVDEAHSSQSGKNAHQMKASLTDTKNSLEKISTFENKAEDVEDRIAQIMAVQGNPENLSFFAFTATPKNITLEIFGKPVEISGQNKPAYRAHHIYSMRQAIEEGFILDVLKNYMTYEVSYNIANNTPENPEVSQSKTVKAISRYASLHPTNIKEKTKIMADQYINNTSFKINGKAKAMVVSSSRRLAVRYFREFQRYIKTHGYEDEIGILVAFSGTVTVGGIDYTESTLNQTKDGRSIKSQEIPSAFNTPEFNILVVAEKYQTGFDQPLLHTMFVDKPLRGMRAVQTLSRLNRPARNKKDTFVLDFVNETEDIQEAFEPYYQYTELEKGTDINEIYTLQEKIRSYGIYNTEDVNKIVDFYYTHENQTEFDLGILSGMYKPIINHYRELNEVEGYEFRIQIRRLVKSYGYITQITKLFDRDLEKEYRFLMNLIKLLPKENDTEDFVDIEDKLELQYYKLKETYKGNISLNPDSVDYVLTNPEMNSDIVMEEETKVFLNDIINNINDRYHGDFNEKNKVQTQILHEDLTQNKSLKKAAKTNNENIYIDNTFSEAFDDSAMKNLDKNPEKFESLFQDQELYDEMKSVLAKFTYRIFRNIEEKV